MTTPLLTNGNGNGRALALARAPLPDAAPRTIAEAYRQDAYGERHERRLNHFRGDFYEYRDGAHRPIVDEILRSRVAEFADGLEIESDRKTGPATIRFRTSRYKVTDIIDALAGLTQIMAPEMPAWLDQHRPDPRQMIAFRNGLLNVKRYVEDGDLLPDPPTPMWFSTNVLPFDLRSPAQRRRDG